MIHQNNKGQVQQLVIHTSRMEIAMSMQTLEYILVYPWSMLDVFPRRRIAHQMDLWIQNSIAALAVVNTHSASRSLAMLNNALDGFLTSNSIAALAAITRSATSSFRHRQPRKISGGIAIPRAYMSVLWNVLWQRLDKR
jgi:hypothetical protein